jgi:hypothetical protein
MADPVAPQDAWQKWFLSVWEDREDRVYRQQFGDLGSGVHPARAEHYARLKQAPRHPGWLHHGVFACPPHGARQNWVYATSGLSNPWNLSEPGRDPAGYSGVGFELLLWSRSQVDWAVQLLHHLMAWQLLVATAAVEGQPLGPGQRVPLGGSIDGTAESQMTWALCEKPGAIPAEFELPSGKVEWLQLTGVLDAEVQFARKGDQAQLVQRLEAQGVWPLTDPARSSVTP